MPAKRLGEFILRQGRFFRLLVCFGLLVTLLLLFTSFDLRLAVLEILTWIDQAGPKGPLIFFLLYTLAGVVMFPGVILTLGAGFLFGVGKGSLLVYFSATSSAAAGFLASRYLARDLVISKIRGNHVFQSLDRAVTEEGWKIVGLTRLSPVFPYNVLNYAFGLTGVSLRDYVLASFLGMIPMTTVYVYLGSLAGNIAELGTTTQPESRSVWDWILYGAGLVVTVTISLMITRIARRALQQKIEAQQKAGSD